MRTVLVLGPLRAHRERLVNDAVHAEPRTVPFVIQHRGELIGEAAVRYGVTVVDITPMEPAWQDNPKSVGPVPGATEPPQSS
ncbi:hypothetical protein EDD91_0154 [Streptomyces sp. KS 21]|nr:hypothetical protein EDD91_0154 [Streptomyces sp. KS 21]